MLRMDLEDGTKGKGARRVRVSNQSKPCAWVRVCVCVRACVRGCVCERVCV